MTVARHPLDVLISILHFCIYESESEHWLLGAGGSESGIQAAMPRSRPFVEYATGPRAAALLAVTPDWWGRPDVLGIKYEDCIRDTDAELRRIEAAFGPVRDGSRAVVIEACSLGELRKGAINNHFWKGSPGLWRALLPAAETAEIAPAVPVFVRPSAPRPGRSPRLRQTAIDCRWSGTRSRDASRSRPVTRPSRSDWSDRRADAHIAILEAKPAGDLSARHGRGSGTEPAAG